MSDIRSTTLSRSTGETSVRLELVLDGEGKTSVSTGFGMLDHMLTLTAFWGRFDLKLVCTGDMHVDAHHTAEDVAICLGKAFREALGDRKGIARVGWARVPMDEALADRRQRNDQSTPARRQLAAADALQEREVVLPVEPADNVARTAHRHDFRQLLGRRRRKLESAEACEVRTPSRSGGQGHVPAAVMVQLAASAQARQGRSLLRRRIDTRQTSGA